MTARVGAVLAGVLVATCALSSTPVQARTRLQVEAGFDGVHFPGAVVPVWVEVRADRLVRGSLNASTGAGSSSVPVEASAGTVKRYLLHVDTAVDGQGSVEVGLVEGERAIAKARASLEPPGDRELVGLLPALLGQRPLPGSAPLSVDVGTAKFVKLDEALLDTAPTGLYSLSTIAASPRDLRQLSPLARRGIFSWISHGGRLLVDAAPGDEVDGLPRAWHPARRSDRAYVGTGEVVFTGDAMAAQRWDGLIEPSARTRFAGSGTQTFLPQILADEAGIRLPPLEPVFVLLGLYVFLVGPVLYFVLRSRRREVAAWVLIPALAVAFTALSFIASFAVRGTNRVAHGTIVTTSSEGLVSTAIVGVTSPRGGSTRIAMPGSTYVGSLTQNAFGGVRASSRGKEATVRLNTGQFATLYGSRHHGRQGELAVSATVRGDEVTGTVRNTTPHDLEEVGVILGDVTAKVGRLGVGEARTWRAPVDQPHEPGSVGMRLWRDQITSRDDLVNYGLWQALAGYGGVNPLVPGRVVAAGWTREFRPAIEINGRSATPTGTSLVVGYGRAAQTSGKLSRLAVLREQVRGPQMFFEDPGVAHIAGNQSDVTYRFSLPRGSVSRKLQVVAPFGATVDAWAAEGWLRVDPPDGDDRGPQADDAPFQVLPEPPGPPAVPDAPGFGGDLATAAYALPRTTEDVIFVRVRGGAVDFEMPGQTDVWLEEAA